MINQFISYSCINKYGFYWWWVLLWLARLHQMLIVSNKPLKTDETKGWNHMSKWVSYQISHWKFMLKLTHLKYLRHLWPFTSSTRSLGCRRSVKMTYSTDIGQRFENTKANIWYRSNFKKIRTSVHLIFEPAIPLDGRNLRLKFPVCMSLRSQVIGPIDR